MNGMEPEVMDFLKKVLQSVFMGLLWMMTNMTIGIFFGLLFINEKISAGNIIFYIFFIVSLAWIIRFYYRTWKNKFPHG
jgi:hypothetical protein